MTDSVSVGTTVSSGDTTPKQGEQDSADRDVALGPGEQYRLVVEDAQSLGDRRETINNLFVGTVSLLIGGEAYVFITFTANPIGLIAMILGTVFGWRLCKIWGDALGSYSILLNFRYASLKVWEDKFSSLHRYYISEDMLYAENKSYTSTDLTKALNKDYPRNKSDDSGDSWVGSLRTGIFSNMYKELPGLARVILIALTVIQFLALAGRVLLLLMPSIVPPHLFPFRSLGV